VTEGASEVSLRSTLTPLAPTGRRRGTLSTRGLLERFNLPIDKGVWFCSQLTDVDAIEIVAVTADRSGSGTDGTVSLNVGGTRSWRLNEDILQHDWHNDFRRGATDFFTIDPALDGEPLHLSEIRRLQLTIRANFDFLGPWRPAHVTIRINGWPVFEGQVRQEVAPNRPWNVPNYPRAV
jgi:hypothetical protein